MSKWKERVETYKALQRCGRCGSKDAYTMNGKQLCYECAEKDKAYSKMYHEKHREESKKAMRDRYERLKSEGVCVACGQRKARSGLIMCQRCATKNTLNCKRWLARRSALEGE